MEVSIDSIVVENRFRQDMGDMQALQDSIKANGLLQPIGVDKDRRLVFGGRRLAACKALGLVTIEAKVVDCDALIAENDENEVRKAFTVSERVAIAAAVAERLKGRQGSGPAKRGGNISTSLDDSGKTRDLAAAKAGLGSGKTLEAAQVVIAKGAPELVAAMDAGKVTIHAAKSIASMPAEEQLSVNYEDPKDVSKARNRAHSRELRASNKSESASDTTKEKPDKKPKADEQRLYSEGSSLSAFVLAARAVHAISQISKKDPNAIAAMEDIQAALNKQLFEITSKDEK